MTRFVVCLALACTGCAAALPAAAFAIAVCAGGTGVYLSVDNRKPAPVVADAGSDSSE